MRIYSSQIDISQNAHTFQAIVDLRGWLGKKDGCRHAGFDDFFHQRYGLFVNFG
jgi:hypothetical protein